MIIDGGSRRDSRWFSRHLTNERDNDKVTLVAVHDLMADSVPGAFEEMRAMAQGAQATNWFYHASINPREAELLTPDQERVMDAALARNLHLDDQPGFLIRHEKEGRVHYHWVRYRIDDDGRVISDSFTAPIHERTSRELEQEFGLSPVQSVLVKDREDPRPERRPRSWENFRANRSGIDPHQVKAEVTSLWHSADSGQAFKAALEDHGYILAKGDRRDFVIVDQAGDVHSLAKRIKGARAADVRERMKDVDRDALPGVEDVRARLVEAYEREEQEAQQQEPLSGARAHARELAEAMRAEPEPQHYDRDAADAAWMQAVEDAAIANAQHSRSIRATRDLTINVNVRFNTPRSVREHARIVVEVMRGNGGHIEMGDGTSWWDKTVAYVGQAREQLTQWYSEQRDYWQARVESWRSQWDMDRGRSSGPEIGG